MNTKKLLYNVGSIVFLFSSNLCIADWIKDKASSAVYLPSGQSSPAGDVTHRLSNFDCGKFDEDHTSQCVVRMWVDVKPNVQWSMLACFGEVEYKQVYEGRVETHKLGFLVSATRDVGGFPTGFRLDKWVEFSEHYKALDPKLSWTRCEVIEYKEL